MNIGGVPRHVIVIILYTHRSSANMISGFPDTYSGSEFEVDTHTTARCLYAMIELLCLFLCHVRPFVNCVSHITKLNAAVTKCKTNLKKLSFSFQTLA